MTHWFTPVEWAILLAFTLSRILWSFLIDPGNAPDENAHMGMSVALANGKLLTLNEGLAFTGYPYALYNPLAYFPGVVLLKVYGWITQFPATASIDQFGTYFFEHCYVVRLGQLFWSIPFAMFALRLVKEYGPLARATALILLFAVPQILYVQAYVNLDAMGLTACLYLLWALRRDRPGHVAAALFLIGSAKMNFYAAFAAPVVWGFVTLVQTRTMPWRLVGALAIGFIPVVGWVACTKLMILPGTNRLFGFSALNDIYHFEGAGKQVFTREFLMTSLASVFCGLGWMNQWLPALFYRIWKYLVLAPLLLSALVALVRRNILPPEAWASLSVVAANLFLHYYASYTNAYQPQGRYLFGGYAFLVILGTRADWGPLAFRFLRKPVFIAGVAFFTVTLAAASLLISKNPFDMGRMIFKPREGMSLPHLISADTAPRAPLGLLQNGVVVRQPFLLPCSNLHRVDVLVSTYARVNPGWIEMRILRGDGTPLRHDRFPSWSMIDNGYQTFTFPALNEPLRSPLILEVETGGNRFGRGLTLWARPQTNGLPDLLTNGQPVIQKILDFKLGYFPGKIP